MIFDLRYDMSIDESFFSLILSFLDTLVFVSSKLRFKFLNTVGFNNVWIDYFLSSAIIGCFFILECLSSRQFFNRCPFFQMVGLQDGSFALNFESWFLLLHRGAF